MHIFYDTCSLLNKQNEIFNNDDEIFISHITLKELESIKTSATKDPEIKYAARMVIRSLSENEGRYKVAFPHIENFDVDLDTTTNDAKIIISALEIQREYPDLVFYTDDLCCRALAKSVGLNVKSAIKPIETSYSGFKYVDFNNDEELAILYADIYDEENNKFNMLVNQYLFVRDKNTNKVIDKYRYTNEHKMEKVPFRIFESTMFGKIKPQDEYQAIAMDSLSRNQFNIIKGPAGSGKSLISLAFLFQELEKNRIDKIVIACNPVASKDSARLGFTPGSLVEKILDTQLGGVLISHLGDRNYVEKLISDGQLILVPTSNIRGFSCDGRVGYYFTEAQNLSIYLAQLTIQRCGENAKIILEGDDNQVDMSIYGGNNNGMNRAIEVFKGDECFGVVKLEKIHRSHICELAQLM